MQVKKAGRDGPDGSTHSPDSNRRRITDMEKAGGRKLQPALVINENGFGMKTV